MEVSKQRESGEDNLKVICRVRPLINIELELIENKELEIKYPDEYTVAVPKMQGDYESFNFDYVFPSSAGQEEIFKFIGEPIIEDILKGYNGTVFAYGQTGSGKTFTMMGGDIQSTTSQGLIPRSFDLIFKSLALLATETDTEFTVKVSMLEIYREKLKDLIGQRNDLKIKQDKRRGIYVEGLTEVYVVCLEEIMEILELGGSNRTVASTNMNTASSRSHQLIILEIIQKLHNDSEKRGILNLVDLAGSEKINQTGVTGSKLEEAKKINLSLSALGNVIKALTNHSEHIPYRDSKLTRLLQESLGGNFKTTLVVNCSPHPRNLEDTINTLKFAQRAKKIKNKAYVNIKKSAEAYIRIIEELKKQLAATVQELETYKSGKLTPNMAKSTEEKSPTLLDTSIDSRIYDLKIEENYKIEELLEKINSFKEDQDYYYNRIDELQKELDEERKKRLKLEKKCFEYAEKCNKSKDIRYNNAKNEKYIQKNKSLKKQIEILKFHLLTINQKFNNSLMKLKKGESIGEWEYEGKYFSDENMKLPVYSDEESLEIVNKSEFAIDIPINDTILLSNDRYAHALCGEIEEMSLKSKDLLIFELRKQFIQSNIINCEFSRGYYELLWKYKLLREKMNMKSKLITTQKQRIHTLEKSFNFLHISFVKMSMIIEAIEKGTENPDKNADIVSKAKFLRFAKAPVPQDESNRLGRGLAKRNNNRLGTSIPIQMNLRPQRFSVNFSGGDSKSTYLESNLQMQSLYNNQLKIANENATLERNSYKQLLDDYIKENSEIYLKEKRRWKIFVDEFKEICEKELVRKQFEINKLNELLGLWMHRYMEMEESLKRSCKISRSQHYNEQIEDLLERTNIYLRPTKINIVESPLHCKFKSNISTHVSFISGDSSPPSFD